MKKQLLTFVLLVVVLFASTATPTDTRPQSGWYNSQWFKSFKSVADTNGISKDFGKCYFSEADSGYYVGFGTHFVRVYTTNDGVASSDSIAALRVDINKNKDSLAVHLTGIQSLDDTVAAHLVRLTALDDSVAAHLVRIAASEDTVAAHLIRIAANEDSVGALRTDISAIEDTTTAHLGRIVANEDSISTHRGAISAVEDSVDTHRTEIDAVSDSVGVHRTAIDKNADSLGVHLTSIQAFDDSVGVHRTAIDALDDTVATHLISIQALDDSTSVHRGEIDANADSVTAHRTDISALDDTASAHLARIAAEEDSTAALRADIPGDDMTLTSVTGKYAMFKGSTGSAPYIIVVDTTINNNFSTYAEAADTAATILKPGILTVMDAHGNESYVRNNGGNLMLATSGYVQSADSVVVTGNVTGSEVGTFASIKLTTGANAGYYLTSDASGNGTWAEIDIDSTWANITVTDSASVDTLTVESLLSVAGDARIVGEGTALYLDYGSSGSEDHDVAIYFSDDGNNTAHSIIWDDGDDRFELNDDIYVAGEYYLASNTYFWRGNATKPYVHFMDGYLNLAAGSDEGTYVKIITGNTTGDIYLDPNTGGAGMIQAGEYGDGDTLALRGGPFIVTGEKEVGFGADSCIVITREGITLKDGSGNTDFSVDGDGNVTSSGNIAVASYETNVSPTELGYLDGVTSAIQTQLSTHGDTLTAHLTRFGVVDDTTAAVRVNVESNQSTIAGKLSDLVDDTTPQLGGVLDLNEKSIQYDIPDADGEYSGDVANYTVGENVSFGDVLYKKSDGKWWKADAGSNTTMLGRIIAVAAINADASGLCMRRGYIREDDWNWTVGNGIANVLFVDDGTAGGMVQEANKPSDSGDILQVVGEVHDADTIFFDPSGSWVDIT